MKETGTYNLTVFSYLIDKGYFVVSENALKIKKYLNYELRKTETDKKMLINWRSIAAIIATN